MRWALVGGAVAGAPLVILNLAVAFFGSTVVFPLSPYFLREKARALGLYFVHRPGCLLGRHPPLDRIIARAERKYALPRGLLAALVKVESNERVHRISTAGAMGPGQLTPGTARMLRVEDPFDPAESLDGSARYLAAQLARFGDVRLALAAYNAGPGSIVRRRVPRNGETEHYVVKVMAAYAATKPTRTPRS